MTTLTPNLNLNLPNFNESPWHDEVNDNFKAIDAVIKSLFGIDSLKGQYVNSTAVVEGERYYDAVTGFYYEAAADFITLPTPTTFAEERANFPTRWTLLDAARALNAASEALASATQATEAIATIQASLDAINTAIADVTQLSSGASAAVAAAENARDAAQGFKNDTSALVDDAEAFKNQAQIAANSVDGAAIQASIDTRVRLDGSNVTPADATQLRVALNVDEAGNSGSSGSTLSSATQLLYNPLMLSHLENTNIAGNNDYVVDQWRAKTGGGATFRRVAVNGQGAFGVCIEINDNANPQTGGGTAENTYITQPLEGSSILPLNWGSNDAVAATVGILLFNKNAARNISVALQNGNKTVSFTKLLVMPSGLSFHRIVVPAKTDGTWSYGTGIGLELHITTRAGASFVSAVDGEWSNGDFVAALGHQSATGTTLSLQVLAVTMFAGDVALTKTDMLRSALPVGLEELRCKRYWERLFLRASDQGTTDRWTMGSWATEKRRTPAISVSYLGTTQTSGPNFDTGGFGSKIMVFQASQNSNNRDFSIVVGDARL